RHRVPVRGHHPCGARPAGAAVMASVPVVVSVPRRSRMRRPPALTIVGASILTLIVRAAILAPPILPWGPTEIDFNAPLSPPLTPHHLLGTDRNGMDILSRVIYAARIDLGIAIAAVTIAVLVGGTIGAIVGYVGGWVDDVTMRVVDIFQSFPAFILALGV